MGRRICAWCKAVMVACDPTIPRDSHGMCAVCAAQWDVPARAA